MNDVNAKFDLAMIKKMFKKKIKTIKKKSILDFTLWFIENYLPQKNNLNIKRESYLNNLEVEVISKIQKLAFLRSRSLTPKLENTKVSFTIGNWALPFLNLLKRIRFLQ